MYVSVAVWHWQLQHIAAVQPRDSTHVIHWICVFFRRLISVAVNIRNCKRVRKKAQKKQKQNWQCHLIRFHFGRTGNFLEAKSKLVVNKKKEWKSNCLVKKNRQNCFYLLLLLFESELKLNKMEIFIENNIRFTLFFFFEYDFVITIFFSLFFRCLPFLNK